MRDHGRWHSVMMVLEKQNLIPGGALTAVKAYYTLDGRRLRDAVQISVLSMANGAVTSRIDPVDRWGRARPAVRYGHVRHELLVEERDHHLSVRNSS